MPKKPSVLDYVKAHYKVLVGLAALLLVQFVGSETADWVIVALGALGIGGTPNDPDALRRVYPRKYR